jgi:hypothetical protein
MPNVDLPIGFVPKGVATRANEYEAAAACYPGDLVALTNAGRVTPASAGATAAIGVALTYASGAGQKVLVCDDANQLYVVQADDSTIDAQTDINLNFNIVAGTASTQYRMSRMELDGDTGATDSNLPLKLLAVEPRVGEALGANAKCVVKINNHVLAGGTGTLGV